MEKINIAGLLCDCPQGMELDCTCADNVVFDKIIEYEQIKCVIGESREPLILDKYGRLLHICCPKCVIFPKGKTTWKGFVPPIKFKDGDIVYIRATFDWVCIYKENKDTKNFYKYVAISLSSTSTDIVYDKVSLCRTKDLLKMRIATEKEKQKLFDAIKASGYKWNAETKTLEKLPKFKVGDRIKPIGSDCSDRCYRCFIIKNIEFDRYIFNDGQFLRFTDEHHYELAPNKFDILKLKPFDRVLVRTDNKHVWSIQFFERLNKLKDSFVCMGGWSYRQCIPYKSNEHLLNTVNDCDDFYKTWEK